MIYSVSELNQEAKQLLFRHFSMVQVEGEISNLSQPASGHLYFSLKDKTAQIRCAMFKWQQNNLLFKPKNGQQVCVMAQVSLYEARGDYQLIAESMHLANEENLNQAFQQLKAKLEKQGYFESNLKQAIPTFPQGIGVITSATGAAIHDVLSVLKRRFAGISVIIYPSLVQGEYAPFQLVEAINMANTHQKVEVLLLVRGGGSLEDLWAFNEESVAMAIHHSHIPIISGVGHEVDITIADLMADLRASTPSVAAEYCVPNQQQLVKQFQTMTQRLQLLIETQFIKYSQTVDLLSQRLQQQQPQQRLQRYTQTVASLESRLMIAIQNQLKYKRIQLHSQKQGLFQQTPLKRIRFYWQHQQSVRQRLQWAIQQKIQHLHVQQQAVVATLHAVSPLATLERGYTLVTQTHKLALIKNTQSLRMGQCIKTRFSDGFIISEVKEITHE